MSKNTKQDREGMVLYKGNVWIPEESRAIVKAMMAEDDKLVAKLEKQLADKWKRNADGEWVRR